MDEDSERVICGVRLDRKRQRESALASALVHGNTVSMPAL